MLMLSLLLPLAAGVSAEPACLLQKPKAPTQLSLLAETPVAGWEYAGKGDCNLPLGSILRPDPMSCASWCATDHPSAIAFSFGGLCDCCEVLVLNTGSSGFAYARAVPSWQFLGVGKFCGTPALSLPSTPLPPSLNDCAASCGINQWMLYVGTGATGAPATCDCCATEFLIDSAIPEQFVYYSKLPGWVYAGLGACDPTTISTQLPLSGPNECADHCRTQAAPGFSYDVGSRECHCCFGVRVQTNPDPTVTPYVYVLADPFWRFFAADQKCVNPVRTSFHTTLAGCAKTCEPPDGTWKWLVYGYNNEQDRCDCCNDAGLEAVPPGGNGGLLSLGPYGGLGYQLDPLTFPDVPGWSFGGRRMDCDGAPVATTLGSPSPSSCAAFCANQLSGSFVIDPNFPTSTAATCKCCGILQQEGDPSSGAYGYWRLFRDDGGGVGVYGDPHITALDGSHYLLLSQGTFSLWHLHGLLTEFQTQDGFKKVPVEWEIFTHYSGHQSFTKGLLLIDRSAGVQRQVLEITSQDCQWRAHSGAEWTMVNKPGMISVGQDYVTGFNMTKTNGRKHRGGHASRNQLNLNQVHLSMNSKDGATDIAVLTVSCRPKRNLNLNLVMKRRSDHGFVEGELAGRKKLAALETDSEFNIKGKWQDVGGSDQAAAYLRQMDEDSSLHVSLLQSCTPEDKVQAKITCSKYLDSLGHLDPAGFFLNDCVYDVCHGAGEVAAELAAELLTSASV